MLPRHPTLCSPLRWRHTHTPLGVAGGGGGGGRGRPPCPCSIPGSGGSCSARPSPPGLPRGSPQPPRRAPALPPGRGGGAGAGGGGGGGGAGGGRSRAVPPAAPAQVSGTGTVGGGGAWGAPRRRCGSGRRGRGSVPHRGPVTAGGGGAGSRGEAFSPSPHPGMNPEAEPTQPHRHPPGPGVPTRDHPHPRWRDARLLAQPVSSSASCPPAAVGCVGVGHPDTASPSARGDSDAGGEWGWGGVSASTVSVNRPVVPTDQCHAISSRWPFQDLLACKTDGSRERGCTERHEPSEQDPWFGDVGRHVSWHGEEGCRKGRASPKSQTAPQSSREAAAEGPQSCVLLLCQRQLPAGAGPQGLDVSPGLAGDAHIPAGAALDFPLHASTPRLGFPWGSSQVLGVGRCCLPPRWAPGTPARRSGRC